MYISNLCDHNYILLQDLKGFKKGTMCNGGEYGWHSFGNEENGFELRCQEMDKEPELFKKIEKYHTCPFCEENEFDLIGLKMHYIYGWCEKFNEIDIR